MFELQIKALRLERHAGSRVHACTLEIKLPVFTKRSQHLPCAFEAWACGASCAIYTICTRRTREAWNRGEAYKKKEATRAERQVLAPWPPILAPSSLVVDFSQGAAAGQTSRAGHGARAGERASRGTRDLRRHRRPGRGRSA